MVHGDIDKAKSCNINLPKVRVNMFRETRSNRTKEARLKRPITTELAKIGILEKHHKRNEDNHLSYFDKKKWT